MKTHNFGSFLAIGWIPNVNFDRLPKQNECVQYASGSGNLEKACRLLFDSGNSAPPVNKIEISEFEQIRDSKEFRAVLQLHDIQLTEDPHGRLRATWRNQRFANRDFIGYTPVRRRFLGINWVLYLRGEGKVYPPDEPVDTGNSLKFRIAVKFRICWIGNVYGRHLTGYPAPDVWMVVDFELSKSGTGTAEISGSRIPSQRHYFQKPNFEAFVQKSSHNMMNNKLHEIKGVMEGGSGWSHGNYFKPINIP